MASCAAAALRLTCVGAAAASVAAGEEESKGSDGVRGCPDAIDTVPIPAGERRLLATENGMLVRELLAAPGAVVPPLVALACNVSDLCTPERYSGGFVPLFLFLARQVVRLQVCTCGCRL